jgi:hypothetical protein
MKRKRKSKPEHLFERIAAENNTTVEEVRKEIELAIRAGLANPDPKVRAEWAKIPKAGEIPTPEETIAYCVRQIKKGKSEPLLRWYIIQ